MNFSIIAAHDARRGIGKRGTIPWHLKADLEHFRDVTMGKHETNQQNVVIMGKTTWLSLPEKFRPLPNRLNIVLSYEPLELPTGVQLASSFEGALTIANQAEPNAEIFVIGGGSVYAQAILDQRCQTIYLTEIDGDYQCDTFFPDIPETFDRTIESEATTDIGVKYRFVRYHRRVSQAT